MAPRAVAAVLAAIGSQPFATLAADRPEPQPSPIKKRYWQVLPGVRVVAVDGLGNVWLGGGQEGSIEKSYRSKLKRMPESQMLLLGDRQGRLWVNDRYRDTPTRRYDGRRWEKLPFRAQRAFEDSGGRVFLVGPKRLHVLDGGKWTTVEHGANGVEPGWRMVEDPSGGVWLWACRGQAAKRPAGAWCFHRGRWRHLTAKSGLPSDRVETIVPRPAGRYLVSTDERSVSPNFVVWAWQEAGGKPVPKVRQCDFLPGVSARHLRYEGVDDDGSHYFSATGLIQDHQDVYKGDTVVVSFPPKGRGRLLTNKGQAFFRSAPRGSDRLYFSLKDPNAWDGERLHSPPVDGAILCRDRLGRIFSRARSSGMVEVLWPAHERPGDLIRPRRQADLGLGRAFQDSGGGIWFQTDRRLLRWSGSGWDATPVERKPHPQWRAEPAPPWYAFDRGLHVICGSRGALLAVAVRDVYQDGGGGRVPWRHVRKRGRGAKEAGQPIYWLEGWLWRNGSWAGPMKIRELIAKHLSTFRKQFTLQTPAWAYFDLQSDGRRVWVAYNSTVSVFSPDGKALTWSIPLPKSWQRLLPVNLVVLPDGKVWCAYLAGRDLNVVRMEFSKAHLRPRPLPEAGMKNSQPARWAKLHLSREGQLWRSHPRGTSVWQADPSPRKGGAWKDREDLGRLVLADDDGALWFARKPGRISDRGYDILHNGVMHKLDWPVHLPTGAVTRAAPRRWLASCQRFVVSIVSAGKGSLRTWKIGRVHLLADLPESEGVFLDGRGHLIGAAGWSGEFPTPADR